MFVRLNRHMTAVTAGIAASFIAIASPSFAQDGADVVVRGLPEGTEMEMVSYRDLDLRLVAHLDILNRRVDRAVRHVCDYEPGDRMRDSYRDCADGAWAGARPQMHRAYLQANRLAYR